MIVLNYENVETKKTMMYKVQCFLNSFFSVFKRKQKTLPEATVETSEEYEKIRENFERITKDDSFENLKETYNHYIVGTNSLGKTVAVEKDTGYVIEDPKFIARVRFISIWRKSAIGNSDAKDEIASVEECFCADSEGIFGEIYQCIQKQLIKKGNINTLEVLNELKNSHYKWGRSTSRRLFRNEIQCEIVTDFFRSITPKAKKQTKKTLTTSQSLYGMDK